MNDSCRKEGPRWWELEADVSRLELDDVSRRELEEEDVTRRGPL